MKKALLAALLVPAIALTAAAKGPKKKEGRDAILVLNGERTGVYWSDGDSFKFTAGPHEKKGTRLAGYNALEAYGPVHRWGDWKPEELQALSKQAMEVAASQEWDCVWSGKADGYERMLIDCRGLTKEMLRRGLGMLFAMDEAADPELVKLQKEAQEKKLGMWEKGVPPKLITSAHSKAEGKAYNRVVDTATGKAEEAEHDETYATCQEVCVGKGKQASCLLYVPYENRYKPKDKAECLKKKPLPEQ